MAQARRELQPGEHVSWNYGAGHATGQVVEKLTENTKLGSRTFKASPDDPKYLVKSDTSGKEAIKKPETLHKLEEDPADLVVKKEKSIMNSRQQQVSSKEKRDGLKERFTKDEKREADREEEAKKVADIGKGSVRESAKVAMDKFKVGEVDDAGEERDETYDPPKDVIEEAVIDDEEAIESLPSDKELERDEKEGANGGDQEAGVQEEVDEDKDDVAFEPPKEELEAAAEDDEAAIALLPSDKEVLRQVDEDEGEREVAAGRL